MVNCKDCGPNSYWGCRHCHDEVMYEGQSDFQLSHQMDRFAIKKVKCLRCGLAQEKNKTCKGCKEDFAKYYCEICCLYDDDAEAKGNYHCEKCGKCNAGGAKNNFHCDTCETCYPLRCSNHKCKKAAFKENCPFCLKDLFSSTTRSLILSCGHCMHESCLI